VELLVQQAAPARQVLAPHMEAVARSQLQQHEAARQAMVKLTLGSTNT
jgi:hypothetical protein